MRASPLMDFDSWHVSGANQCIVDILWCTHTHTHPLFCANWRPSANISESSTCTKSIQLHWKTFLLYSFICFYLSCNLNEQKILEFNSIKRKKKILIRLLSLFFFYMFNCILLWFSIISVWCVFCFLYTLSRYSPWLSNEKRLQIEIASFPVIYRGGVTVLCVYSSDHLSNWPDRYGQKIAF